MTPPIAFVISTRGWELTGLVSAVMTLSGVWLRWRSQSHVSDIEEAMKNGKLSADAARRRMRFIERRATLLIFGGVALMAATAAGLHFLEGL